MSLPDITFETEEEVVAYLLSDEFMNDYLLSETLRNEEVGALC